MEIKPTDSIYKQLWTAGHRLKAENEGWNLFRVDSGEELQLQRDDEMGIFEADHEAWTHVWNKSVEGDKTAINALAIIAKESPKELARIKKHLGLDNYFR